MTPNPGGVPETGIPSVDTLLIWCSAAVAVAGFFGLGWRIIRWLRHIGRRAGDLADDWQGVPDRPGVPGRPGIMTRLATIETQTGLIPGIDDFDVLTGSTPRPDSMDPA